MASVTAIFAKTLIAAAGREVESILTVAEDDRLSAGQYFDLVTRLQQEHPDPVALPLAYAALIDVDSLGVLGLALKAAPTLRDTLLRIQRYFSLVTDTVSYRLKETPGLAHFEIKSLTPPHPSHSLRNECALAAFAGILRRLNGPELNFAEVTFRHPQSGDPRRLEAFFGCPVHFRTDRDAMSVAPAMLDLRNRLGDAAISQYLTDQLEIDMARSRPPETMRDRVDRHLANSLSAGVPTAAEVAQALGMSERSLYRRLSDEGVSYQEVLREARRALAERLLSQGEASIGEVAFMTGFSEQSTFTRAFKSWAGLTPARFREASAG